MESKIREQLLVLKGGLLAIREGLDVGYYSYLNAIDRRLKNEHTTADVKALQHLEMELIQHYLTPRSEQEARVLEGFIEALKETLRTTQIQLQTT